MIVPYDLGFQGDGQTNTVKKMTDGAQKNESFDPESTSLDSYLESSQEVESTLEVWLMG